MQVAGEDLSSGLLKMSESFQIPTQEVLDCLVDRFAKERNPQSRELLVRGLATAAVASLQVSA